MNIYQYLQNSASRQPRTNPDKFAVSLESSRALIWNRFCARHGQQPQLVRYRDQGWESGQHLRPLACLHVVIALERDNLSWV